MSSDFLFCLMSVYHRVTRNGTGVLIFVFFIIIVQVIIIFMLDRPERDKYD